MSAARPRSCLILIWQPCCGWLFCLGTLAPASYGMGPCASVVVLLCPFGMGTGCTMIGTAKRRCRGHPASQPMSATLTSREGMSDFLAISRPAPLFDAKNTQAWEERHRPKPVLLPSHNWTVPFALCSATGTQVKGRRHGLRPVLHLPHNSGVLAPITDAQVWNGKRGLKPALQPPPQLGGFCFLQC